MLLPLLCVSNCAYMNREVGVLGCLSRGVGVGVSGVGVGVALGCVGVAVSVAVRRLLYRTVLRTHKRAYVHHTRLPVTRCADGGMAGAGGGGGVDHSGRPIGGGGGAGAWKQRAREDGDAHDALFGFARLTREDEESSEPRVGYLMNMLPTTIVGEDAVERAALDMYFLQQNGATFKATLVHQPYFYLAVHAGYIKVGARVVGSLSLCVGA